MAEKYKGKTRSGVGGDAMSMMVLRRGSSI